MTIKQKLATEKVVENGGNVSKAMIDAGYSLKTAHTPQKLTESKGWKELMDKYLPDEDVLRAHQEGLEANKVISARIVGKEANEQTDDFIEVPDHPTRLKAVELAYKVKKKGDVDLLANIQNNYFNLTDEQLDKLIESKRRQTGTPEATTGEGTQDSGESVEVLQES